MLLRHWRFWLWCLLLSSAVGHRHNHHGDPFLFVATAPEGGEVYLIKPQLKTRQLVPQSNDTLASFGYDRLNLTVVKAQELAKFALGKPIKPIIPLSKQCGNLCADERLRVAVDKARTIQGQKLLHNIRYMGRFVNGPLLLLPDGTCLTVATKKPFANHASRSRMVAYELDAECRDKTDKDIYPSTTSGQPRAAAPNRYNFSPNHLLSQSEDVRTLVMPSGRLAMVYTVTRLVGIRPQYSLAYSELALNASTGRLDLCCSFSLANNVVNDRDRRPESSFNPYKSFGYKNWSPFIYNNSVHFVQHLNPLQITTFSDEERRRRRDNEFLYMDLVSFQPHVADWWKLGELRGGTPAHLINDLEYLTFFHSLIHLPDQARGTYFMGAITFSAQAPFHLLRISAAPFVEETLYQGPWMRQRFDYVYYPMAFLFAIRDARNETVYSNSYPAHIRDRNCSSSPEARGVTILLSFGRQDEDTALADIPLCDLDSSLVDVGHRDKHKVLHQNFW